jgi:hypothetical protein
LLHLSKIVRNGCDWPWHGRPSIFCRVPAGNLESGGSLTDLRSPPGDDAIYFYPAGVMAIRLTTSVHTCRCEEISPPTSKEYPMKIPVWLKPGVWGIVVGGIATAVIGFSQLGWTTSGKAELLAQERASTAVVAALVPFCIAKAQQDPDKTVFAKFKAETSSYSRSDMVIKAGWATVGGETSPDNALARACSDKLSSAKTS